MTTIVSVKMKTGRKQGAVGFDKVYFVQREDRDLIPKFFEYAMVLPVTEDLKKHIRDLPVAYFSKYGTRRDDTTVKQHTEAFKTEWWDTFFVSHAIDNCVAVVPMLTKSTRKKKSVRYLQTRQWNHGWGNNLRTPIHELAYLSTPHEAPYDKVQPICNACPRQMLALAGECVPGMHVCFTKLDLNNIVPEHQ